MTGLKFKLTINSRNKKTGVMPTTMSSKNTCPSSCVLLKNGCYGSLGHTNIWWTRLNETGLNFSELVSGIEKLPPTTIWRHNVVGDLIPTTDNGTEICYESLDEIVKANNKGNKKGFCFTHHPLSENNVKAIRHANDNGFTVNHSTDNKNQAISEFKKYGIPTVTILESDAPQKQEIDGVKIIVCPEQTTGIPCSVCRICTKSDRKFIIGFRAHGVAKKKVNLIATQQI